MNVLHCSPADMTSFWNLATSPLHSLLHSLDEVQLPRAVTENSLGIDSIKKAFGFYERSLISQRHQS